MPNTVPGSVIDGASVGYGSLLITFSVSGEYLAENFAVNRPVSTARDRKVTGEPNRSRYTVDFIGGTATLQARSGSAGWPKFGETFTVTVDDNYGGEIFIMMPPPFEASNDPSSLRKIAITFEKQNTSTLTTVAAT